MVSKTRVSVAVALAMSVTTPVLAQGTGTAPAPSSVQGASGDSLSGKLDKSDGVIKPKGDIDPGMKIPAPVAHPNSTPVIPPAATGGQDAK